MRPSKPFTMPPVRLVPPAVKAGEPERKSLQEWLAEEETVQGRHFCNREEEGLNTEHRSITRCTFRHVRFTDCKLVGTDLSESTLQHLLLKDCNARYLNLGMSKLSQVRLTGCDLRTSHIEALCLNLPDIRGVIIDAVQAMELVRLLGPKVKVETQFSTCKARYFLRPQG